MGNRMLIIAFAILAYFFQAVLPVFADGKLFSTTEAKIQAPKQRAVIFYKPGRETLIIESHFSKGIASQTNQASSTDSKFAWIVPLPKAPDLVEKVEPNYLALIARKFKPKVIPYYELYWVGALVISFITLFIRLTYAKPSGIVTVFFSFTSLLAVAFLLFSYWFGEVSFLFGTISGKLSSGGIVNVIERKEIGSFDTATISSNDSVALLTWLNQESYFVSKDIVPVLDSYVRDNWVFFVAKLRNPREAEDSVQPHPLSFSFSTDRAIYPLRLTGVGNGSCTICLYVFSWE